MVDNTIKKERFVRGLIFETMLVYGATLIFIRSLLTQVPHLHWLAVPAILLMAGLLPCFPAKRPLPAIGMDRKRLTAACVLAGIAGLIAFPIAYIAFRLLALRGMSIPLRPEMPERDMLLAWGFYQFFYVAVSEEVFFRAYVQRNIQHILCKASHCPWKNQMVSILVSSFAFGLAHFVVLGHVSALLTVFPGLVLGWLYARTNALFAPILFHGLANIFYSLLGTALLPK